MHTFTSPQSLRVGATRATLQTKLVLTRQFGSASPCLCPSCILSQCQNIVWLEVRLLKSQHEDCGVLQPMLRTTVIVHGLAMDGTSQLLHTTNDVRGQANLRSIYLFHAHSTWRQQDTTSVSCGIRMMQAAFVLLRQADILNDDPNVGSCWFLPGGKQFSLSGPPSMEDLNRRQAGRHGRHGNLSNVGQLGSATALLKSDPQPSQSGRESQDSKGSVHIDGHILLLFRRA